MQEVVQSLQRARDHGLGKRFYERLLSADPRIRRLFAGANFERQRELFEHGVHMLIKFARGDRVGAMALERLGRFHDAQHLDVPPDLYAIWIRCLLETLREVDPEYTEDLDACWREAIQPGIDKMKAMHAAEA
jgi:hemoglobin-like flavoprotein